MGRLGRRRVKHDVSKRIAHLQLLEQYAIPADRCTVQAAIECARQAGIRTVAPCVDSLAIADRLRTLGVDFGYGSALVSPEPLEQLICSPP